MRTMSSTRAPRAIAIAGALSTAAAAPAMAQQPTPRLTPAPKTTSKGAPGLVPAKPAKGRGSFTVGSARHNVTLGNRTLVKGVLRPARPGRRVQLQVGTPDGWETVARDVTNRRGAYRLRFAPDTPSAMPARVAFAGDARTHAVARNIGTINVFRRALASWYGPGLYGGQLACGGRLTPGTLGVAHKELPCGTKITLRYGSRSVRVPVVDRGPYVGAREFDLTSATRDRLGFSGSGTVLATR